MADLDPESLMAASVAMLDAIGTVVSEAIDEHRDELTTAFATVVTANQPRGCSSRSQQGDGCDRKLMHTGPCSWEFDQIVRRYRGYEADAQRLPEVENMLANATTELAAAKRQIVAYTEKRRKPAL
jgi:hypothetical protein